MAKARALAALAACLLLFPAFVPAAAAPTPSGPIIMVLVDLGHSELTVTETVASPGRGSYALWPGAAAAQVLAGLASISGRSFTVPPGVQSAQVSYSVPFNGRSITVRWPFPTKTDIVWLLVGKGLRFPVILNQKFYSAPSTVWNGQAYTVYSAKSVNGVLTLNIQRAVPQASLFQVVLPYLWLVPVLLLAWLILGRLRRRAHA